MPDEGQAGEDVDGGELVHLADAFEVADVEAVDADELARPTARQAEPEGLVVSRRLGDEPGGGRRDGRRPGPGAWLVVPRPWSTRCFCTVDLAMEKPWSPRRSAYWRQPIVGSSTARVKRRSSTWVGVAWASGVPGAPWASGRRARSDQPGSSTRSSGSSRCQRCGRPQPRCRFRLAQCQHGQAALVDDLCWGHGDGLLGSVVGTTESIAGPLKGVDVQPHPRTGRSSATTVGSQPDAGDRDHHVRRSRGPPRRRAPDPGPGPGELALRVHAATVNPTDTVLRSGARADRLKDVPPPHVPGMDAAGTLEQIGEGVDTDLRVGDRVMAIVVPLGAHGAYAERVVVPAESVVRSPAGATDAEAVDAPDERVDGASGPRRVGPRARGHVGRDGRRRRGRRLRRAAGQGRRTAGDRRRRPLRRGARGGAGRRHDRAAGRSVRRGGAPGASPTGSTASSMRPCSTTRPSARCATAAPIATLRGYDGSGLAEPSRRGIAFHPVYVRNYAREHAKLDELCAPGGGGVCSRSGSPGRSRPSRRPKPTDCSKRAASAGGSSWSSDPGRRLHQPRRSTSQRSTTSSPSTMWRCSWYATVGSTCAGSTRTRSPTRSRGPGRERQVLVRAEPHVGTLDRRVAVVHAQRLEPAVRHRPALRDRDHGGQDARAPVTNGRPSLRVGGVHQARRTRPGSRWPTG